MSGFHVGSFVREEEVVTKTARKRYLAYTVLALAIAPAFATQATRTWTFDLRTPGTYEVHVQHKYETADTPQDFVASYAFVTKEKTDKRDISLSLPTGEGYRVAVLRVEVPSSQRATFTATGIPKPLLRKTRVYLVEADSVSPEKMFDPKNSIELPAAKRVREFLIQPPNDIELAKVKLAVDKFIDPAVDVEANLATIGAMIDQRFDVDWSPGRQGHEDAMFLERLAAEGELRPAGFEPATYGLGNRCSIP